MLRKLFFILLALGLVLSFVGCQSNQAPATDPTDETEDVGDVFGTEEIPSVEDESPAHIVLFLPGSAASLHGIDTADLNTFIQEKGLVGAELTDDGSISITLEVSQQNAILEHLSVEIEAAIAAYVQSEATPYIQQIQHSDDYAAFTIQVDGSDYKESFDFASTTLGEKALEYQLYSGKPYTVTVTIQDGATGNILRSLSTPRYDN